MRRWRTAAGDTLAAAPPGDRMHFYLLDPPCRICNTYRRNQYSVQEQLITLEYGVVGDEFYCFGTCEVEGEIREQSQRSELAGLIELSPDDSPTARDVLDALAADRALREADEAAIQLRVAAAARCISGQGRCNDRVLSAAHPPAATLAPGVAALLAALEAFVARLPEEATRADENSDSVYSEEGRCLRQAAEHLRHAIGEISGR